MEHYDAQKKAAVRQRYQEALDAFITKVKQDRYIVAAILFGSLAYDDVWEQSDIDLALLSRDDKSDDRSYSIVENGINMHVSVGPRGKFKAMVEKSLHGNFIHSIMARSTLIFSTDESIRDYYQNAWHVGGQDREMQLLNAAGNMLGLLTKAEKWLIVKQDPTYSFLYIMYMLKHLASIEVLWNYDVPGREVINQALQYNSTFFTTVYTDLIQQPKDSTLIQQTLRTIHAYLDEKQDTLFKPILTYLSREGGVRSASEIFEHLKQWIEGESAGMACEWLADKGILREISAPLRLTEKSTITVNEAAYYYDGSDSDDAYDAE